jgi:predicted short-subunit dehydrogenase-like oxidoreductase (DUF2520 family)
MARQVTIAVIGKGRLGTSLAWAIRSLAPAYSLFTHLPARSTSFSTLSKNDGPDVLFIVCKDKFIARVAKRALAACGKNTSLVVHCAGSLPSSILPLRRNTARLMLHPVQTITNTNPQAFEGIAFAAESQSAAAIKFARAFSKRLGGHQFFKLSAANLARYHAAVVISSNFITLLGSSVEELADTLGIARRTFKLALAPLMQRSLKNVLTHNSKDVLTGPLARRDKETIKRHKAALSKTHSKGIYEAFVKFAESNIKN